ncbi:MAG TPA: DUF86 domain-containing protein [Fervidicoccus fontis]|uniref:DUF86 domain-containing protein n=1 Tax=Fervidicoccus fontis TaxID=683846 RepID=A0A7C2Z274_9CREN|nr:DUF86 domain-containing protein [Fervidicoccus fontis]
MFSEKEKGYLIDILQACELIIEHTKGITFNSFMENKEKQAAVMYWIEIIGEASKRLSQSLKDKYSQVKWKRMAGMRDVLIHNYTDVDYYIVWKVVTNDIPELLEQIKQILNEEF